MKKFLAGLIIGMMLMGAVFADSQTIEVFFNNIKLSVDGNIVELKDANGNPVEPFTYNGTTYLPVRAIAGALNMETKYNETTNTVELTSAKEVKTMEQTARKEPVTIDDYKTVIEEDVLKVQLRPDGTKYIYPNSVGAHLGKVAREYLVKWNDKYPEQTKKSGVIVEIDTNNATVDFILRRYDDERIVLMADVPTNNDSGTFLLPYDEYINNILPQLVEMIKQNGD